MSDESIEWYRHISQATDELREEIKRYEDTGLTPMDFGLRVRSDITALLVTARNKMRSAENRECVISLSGVCIETPEIYSSEEKNANNYRAVERFISMLAQNGYSPVHIQKRDIRKVGYCDIPKHLVIDFLRELDISPKNEQFNISAITNFISGYKGNELTKWDIAFASGKSDRLVDFGYGIAFPCPNRSFTVINNGKILKMTGSKRRLGTSSDGTFGLDEAKLKTIRDKAAADGIANPAQKYYFLNVDRNPLLTNYIVRLKGSADQNDSAIEAAEPFCNRLVV